MEFAAVMYEKMEEQLRAIELAADSILECSERSYRVVEATMRQLKEQMNQYQFADKQQEIYFFKIVKPKFYSLLIYFMKVFETELRMPAGGSKPQKKYLKNKLKALTRYHDDNIAFYKYYRAKATHMDEQYFVRNKYDLLLGLDVSYFDSDPCFCSSHDLKLSRLQANDLLEGYYKQKIEKLSAKTINGTDPGKVCTLHWGNSKAGLIELLYALQSMNVFFNTTTNTIADIKQIASFFELAFHVDLGNYYRTFQEIRIRKKCRTSFIDKLREKLIQRMDDTDENYQFHS